MATIHIPRGQRIKGCAQYINKSGFLTLEYDFSVIFGAILEIFGQYWALFEARSWVKLGDGYKIQIYIK
jgi:hypothetical protein